MSIDMTLQIESTSSKDTEKLGEQIGKRLKGSEVIVLASDLGGGKTTLVRGLARGAGSKDKVASPSFTISKVYQAGKLEIAHFDFYRLSDAGITSHEFQEALSDPGVVVVVEWADVVHNLLPPDTVTIQSKVTGENKRAITIMAPKSQGYLIEGLE